MSSRNVPINLKYFTENSLRKDTSGLQQVVTGDWHFQDLTITGDLDNVLLNGEYY